MKKALIILALISVFALTLLGCSLEIFDWNQRAEIISDYLSWSGLKGNIEAYEVRYKHFGIYGDSVAIYFHTAGAYETPVEEEVAGYTFSYPDSRIIKIWNNGKFYKMQEALDNGLISEDDVKKIHTKKTFLIFREPLFIFEEKIYCDYCEYDHENTPYFEWFSANSFYVCIDTNISNPDKIFDYDFFEDIGILSIEDHTDYLMNFYNDTEYRQYFYIRLTEPLYPNDACKDYVKKAIAILENKDGVRRCIPEGLPYGHTTANDPYISALEIEKGQWSLTNINVEKVWDFTTKA